MNYSQTGSDQKDPSSHNHKNDPIPIVICLDPQSQNQIMLHEQPHDISIQPINNQKKDDQVPKKKRVRKIRKHKKVLREVHEIIDDDIEIVSEKRKSIRLSKKGLRNYRYTQPKRIKRVKPNVEKSKDRKQVSNPIQQSPIGIIQNSQGPVQGLLNKKISIEQPVSLMENDCSVFEKMVSEGNDQKVLESMICELEGSQVVDANKDEVNDQNQQSKGGKLGEQQKVNLQSQVNQQSLKQDGQNEQISVEKDEQNQRTQKEPTAQQNLMTPSNYKFFKRFLEKDLPINKMQAIRKSLIKHSAAKPMKYFQEFQSSQLKSHNQDNYHSVNTVDSHVTVRQSEQEIKLKHIPVIEIQDSDDQAGKNGQQRLVEGQQSMQPETPQLLPMQIDPTNALNQNLSSRDYVMLSNVEQDQDHQKPQGHTYSLREHTQSLRGHTYSLSLNSRIKSREYQIQAQNPQTQEDVSLPPGLRLIKQKLNTKITKKTIYYLNTQQIIRNWQNSPYLSFQQEYPFYCQKKPQSNCNLFSGKVRSIVKIKKYQRPQIHPSTCFVFFQNQSNNNSSNQQQQSIESQYQVPYEAELDKVRLLYPEKLLEFYEMALMANLKKQQSLDKAQTEYDLPERTQDRIKHQFY